MRLLVATLLAICVLGLGTAWAATAYDDVPTDHWAYNALDYLTQRGVLEGYPDGFFKGDRTLTRYEFAQAIARLLDTIGKGTGDEQIRIMADTLRAEFSDQLAELAKNLQDTNNRVADLDSRMGDLEGKVGDTAAKVDDLSKKVAGLKSGFDWKGSFRYRWQFDNQGDYERFRQRIAFQLGFNKQVAENIEFAMRLKTQTGADAISGNHTLGNDGRTAAIYLDRAYVKWSPSWFGRYTDANCNECTPKLDIYAGLFPNITNDPHEMILDSDVNLQGLGAVYHFNKDFQILTAASIAVEHNGIDYVDDDTFLFATEVKHNNLLMNGLDAWVGCYGWKNESNLPDGRPIYDMANNITGYEDDVFGGNALFDMNNDGLIDGRDRFSANYNTVKGGLQYTFQCLFNKPLAVFGEYMVNLDSDAEDRIDYVNNALGYNMIYESSDDYGFVFGAQYGTEPKCKGEWYSFARYKEIGANAIVSGFGDSDAGGANINSLEVHWAYMWAENSLLGITYFLNKMHNAFGYQIPANMDDHSIVQVDWTFKF